LRFLQAALEVHDLGAPERAELVLPAVHDALQRDRVDPVVPNAPALLAGEQLGGLEEGQVLHHGDAADGELARDVGHRGAGHPLDDVEDRPPHGVRQGLEDGVKGIVAHP